MKKYTIYEAIKFSKGKLTRHRLYKAISEGNLKAEKGSGKSKFTLYEDELLKYLHSLGEQTNAQIVVPTSSDKEPSRILEYEKELLKEKERIIQMKEEKITFLETQYQKLLPTVEKEENSSCKRKKLIMELSNLNFFQSKRKKEILFELIEIS